MSLTAPASCTSPLTLPRCRGCSSSTAAHGSTRSRRTRSPIRCTAADPALRRRVLDAARIALDEIDLALARLDEGSFGTCVGCTRSIDAPRLYLVPFARRCGRCATQVSIVVAALPYRGDVLCSEPRHKMMWPPACRSHAVGGVADEAACVPADSPSDQARECCLLAESGL
jgi:hypothetical protein